jgi:2-polyprenyl-3-methyl-5-hydroxy-6-metoxy-1,4-benzoquinol methylase
MRAFICICAWRDVEIQTAYSVMKTMLYPSDIQFAWGVHVDDALIDRARCIEASNFLRDPERGDVLLFVDSDMQFEPHDAVRIVKDAVEFRSIVGAPFIVRSQRYPRPAVRLFPGQRIEMGSDPVQVKYVSTGFMAIHRNVLEAVAKKLPLARSGLDWIWPFFMPMIADDGEYLSEDWAWIARAEKLGFKTWLDPRIRLSHWGRRAYTIEELSMSGVDYITEQLIVSGQVDATNILADYAAYKGIRRSQAAEELKKFDLAMTRRMLADEWQKQNPQTPEEVEDFYKNTKRYIYELILFNLEPRYWQRVDIALRARGRIADLGGGIGTLAMCLAQHSKEMFYIELPSHHRDFAEFRFKRNGFVTIKVRDSLEGLRDLDYVTAVDVIEHIHPSKLEATIKQVYNALRKGGQFIAVNDFNQQDTIPQHFATQEDFERIIRKVGFTGGPEIWSK